mgnify:FL=1
MKLLILTYGTEGDTRPLVALGHELLSSGHDVHLLGDARTLSSAEELGLANSALSGDIRQLFSTWSSQGPKGVAKALVQLTNANTRAWMVETLAAAEGCDAILTSGLAGFIGLSVAERLSIPAIGTSMIPLTPSHDFPSPFLPPGLVPHWLNNASLRLTNQLVWFAFRKSLNEARQTVLGLSARQELPTKHPMLYGISSTILPQPADWPVHARVCGQWQTPAGEFTPPPELADFLHAGPLPVYVGFGSMAGIDGPLLAKTLVAALAGRRALFYPGWSGMGDIELPNNILRIGTTPHDWLLPRTTAVIHHGGSGTAHSATRAGKPSVVIPFAGDQAFWAERLYRLGIAPPALNGAKLDAGSLGKAISFVEGFEVQKRAAELGKQMEKEKGLVTAVREIEKLCYRVKPPF